MQKIDQLGLQKKGKIMKVRTRTVLAGVIGTHALTGATAPATQAAAPVVSVSSLSALSSDFDGDGKADFAVWRPSTAVWYLKFSSHIADRQQQWGQVKDIPL